MNVFLSGFMAAGKTTVGRCLAERLEQPFVDLDQAIESAAGESVQRIFEERGESGFRDLESTVLRRVVADDGVVVALGGGTVLDPSNRELLAERGRLVWLDTPRSTILSRLERSRGRPLYRDPEQASRLLDQRRTAYGDCDLVIRPRPGESAEAIAERLAARLRA